MEQGLVNKESLTAIGNAIREKNKTQDTYTPAEMATGIKNLPEPKEEVEGRFFISTNGTSYFQPAKDTQVFNLVGIQVEVATTSGYIELKNIAINEASRVRIELPYQKIPIVLVLYPMDGQSNDKSGVICYRNNKNEPFIGNFYKYNEKIPSSRQIVGRCDFEKTSETDWDLKFLDRNVLSGKFKGICICE